MKTSFIYALTCATSLIVPSLSMANTMTHGKNQQPHCHECKVNITPNGIRGDHLHKKGHYMLSYTYMNMDMGGLRDNTNSLNDTQVLAHPNINAGPANLRVVPTTMDMDMHMIGAMGGITNKITGMIMIPYLDNSMESRVYNMAGTAVVGTSKMETSGFGDLRIGAITSLWQRNNQRLNGQIGLSLPTGSIEEEDTMLMPSGMMMTMRTPYGMQLGSGTYDLMPTLTYGYDATVWAFGASYASRIHMGHNDEGYTRGDWHSFTGWAGYHINEQLGFSTSLSFKTEDEITGKDNAIMGATPGANPNNYGGEKIHLGFNGAWKFYNQNTFKAGISIPLYQNLNGPQMEDDYALSLRWQNSF